MEGLNEQNKNTNQHLKYWVAYSKISKIGPVNFKKLIDFFTDMKKAWAANHHELISAGLDEKLVNEIIISRPAINPDAEIELMAKENVLAVTLIDNNYPTNLKEIFNPPPILYYRGSLDFLNNICLAVIGTRKFTSYGKQVTEDIVGQLTKNNITIISGLALGIDVIAHKTCLDASGKTMAVLGSGADKQCVYPSSNRYIADRILATGGGIVSEYPVGTNPTKYTFPMRNRIVSGLSKAILVIEAPRSSGSLITAKYALDQNRDIFAIPGNIYNHNSEGTNNLIKEGAKLVTNAADILQELKIQTVFDDIKCEPKIDTEAEKIVFNLLSREPFHIDKIKKMSTLNINVLLSTLTMMEIKGLIKDVGGKNYIKN
ncbi:MAG: DNA-protecting protein DprA [Candidatus Buchananbacteria bacterium CG10_big_fil_rev_8_21_14_0_10_33_19]|uniref:DNA-protecting protein DprA n=1 Tax=Candidatus Buchananbacteria bacterium CG10_big_fil_rev_8_21_14_0_10_33_19 TaxID=1974525 RepID=A0A2H0W2R6_9BACT|nr:MAG: DNA-protecting protein DprA [Candidatus Buchananbacteria bacterium CG10_big_fil_rev_8_21_14_0_10_33_19]